LKEGNNRPFERQNEAILSQTGKVKSNKIKMSDGSNTHLTER
jgi:hypothetical protein